ncbi:MAG: hypothetical protein WD740_00845 [Anaerolineales bacterium]
MHRILTLQDLGFSLDQIRKLLARQVSAEEMRGMLLLKRAEFQDKVREDLERLARIEGRIDQIETSELLPYDIVLRKVEPVRVAALRASADLDFTPLFDLGFPHGFLEDNRYIYGATRGLIDSRARR